MNNFSILDHLGKLTPAQGKNRFVCPACNGNDLTLNPSTGAYSCHHGCTSADIRDAIAPPSPNASRLWTKPPRPRQRREWIYCDRNNQPLIQVIRTDSGSGSKKVWQESLTEGSKPAELLPLVMPYRYADCLKAIERGELVLWVEGEPTADALWSIGIAATTTIRGSDGYSSQYAGLFPAESLVICPDRDKPGLKYSESIAVDYPAARWLYAEPDSPEWDGLPAKSGYDLQDWIESGATQKDILNAISARVTTRGDNEGDKFELSPYKSKLLSIAQIEDPIVRDLEIAHLAKDSGLGFSRVEGHLKYLSAHSPENQIQTVFNLGEFLNNAAVGLDWLVPEMLPKGESVILAAIPKVGKTLLAVDLAYAVATGGEFLGEQLEQGKVLIISTDESPNSAARKLIQRGFRTTDSNVRVMTRFLIQETAPLKEQLRDFKPDLVIIDSLKSICRISDISENSAEFANSIYDVKELLTEYGASGVFIHHETKSKDAEGINKVRGSGAITGATWGVWQMAAQKGHSEDGESVPSGNRILTVTSRDAEGFKTTLKLDPDDFSWCRTFTPEECDARNNQQKILDLLKQFSPRGLEKREIDDHLSIGSSLNKTLSRLAEKHLVTKRPSDSNPRSNVYVYPTSEGDNRGDKGVTTSTNAGVTNPAPGVTTRVTNNFIPENTSPEMPAEQGFQETVRGGDNSVPLGGVTCHPTEKQKYYPKGDKGGDNKGDKGVTRLNHSALKAGDLARYCGREFRAICGEKLLTIVAINHSKAEIQAEGWLVTQNVDLADLKRA